jgi:hypothetical protein
MVFRTYESALYYKNCCHTKAFAAQLEIVNCHVFRHDLNGRGAWCYYTVVMRPKGWRP